MRELLMHLSRPLAEIVPTYIHVPLKTPYPYITLEPDLVLLGLPWGPRIATFSVKIWSRYAGTIEILKLAKQVETIILSYGNNGLKIRESHLELLKDGQTRLHTFKLKTRLPGVS
jgi:hypothetical protein